MPRIDSTEARIAEMKKQDKAFQAKYGCDYETFVRRTSVDDEYVKEVEETINKLWEADQADWEFGRKGIDDWTKKLQTILLTS